MLVWLFSGFFFRDTVSVLGNTIRVSLPPPFFLVTCFKELLGSFLFRRRSLLTGSNIAVAFSPETGRLLGIVPIQGESLGLDRTLRYIFGKGVDIAAFVILGAFAAWAVGAVPFAIQGLL